MAGVRGRAPLYRRSAKRGALLPSHQRPQILHWARLTNPKSHRCSSFSPCLIAGTGRHMANDPCSPTTFFSTAGSSNFFSISPTPLRVHAWSLCIHPQEAFSCASPCLTLPRASKSAQRGSIAAAIAFAVASIISLPQSQHPGEAHQCGGAVVSCRLCLIACNSRQFDEVWGLSDGSESSRDR